MSWRSAHFIVALWFVSALLFQQDVQADETNCGTYFTVDVPHKTSDPLARQYISNYRALGPEFCSCSNYFDRLETAIRTQGIDGLRSRISYDLYASLVAFSILDENRAKYPEFYACFDRNTNRGIDNDLATRFSRQIENPRIIFVPGATRKGTPSVEQGTCNFLQACKDRELFVDFVETPEFGHVGSNACLVRDAILRAESSARPYVIMCLSSGCPATLLAINSLGAERVPNLKSVISISGIPNGTIVADQMTSFPASLWVARQTRIKGMGSLENIRSMTSKALNGLPCRSVLPEHVVFVCCTPIALESSFSKDTKKGFNRLRKFGVNDGVVLTSKTAIPNAIVLPILGADHSFTNHDVSGLGLVLFESVVETYISASE